MEIIVTILFLLYIRSLSMEKAHKKKYTAHEICKMFDVTKKTLFTWEKEGKISKVKKDWRGWRVFNDENVAEIKRIIEEKMRKNQ